MKKHLHFFGCSFTAGDELSDETWFPWKNECATIQEYYSRRNPTLSEENKNDEYQRENKKLAYPALLESDECQTFNHARNGSSLKQCIFNILKTIYSEQTDAIFLQIPPFGREMYVDNIVSTITMRSPEVYDGVIREYLKAKAKSHTLAQIALEDLMDLVMVSNLAKQKNIPFYIVDTTIEITERLKDLAQIAECSFFNQKMFYNEVPLISIQNIIHAAWTHNKILKGGHYSKETHQDIANAIKPFVYEILKPQA